MTEAQPDPFRVFLIDDDEVDVESVRRAFAENDARHEIIVAFDGQEALDLLEGETVDASGLVILLDLNMPRMNGIEFLRALRDAPEHKHLPVVVLTTSDDERDKVEAYQLNVAGYILKPVTFDAFVETMATIEAYWRLQEFPT